MNTINPLQLVPDAASFVLDRAQTLASTVQSTASSALTTVLTTLDRGAERAFNAIAFVDLSDLTLDDDDDY